MCKTLLTVGEKKSLLMVRSHSSKSCRGRSERGGREEEWTRVWVTTCNFPTARFDSAVNITVQRHHADHANLGRRRSGIYHRIGRLIESRTAEGGAEKNTVFKTFNFNECVTCQVLKQFYSLYFLHWKGTRTTFVLKRSFAFCNHSRWDKWSLLLDIKRHSALWPVLLSKFPAVEFKMLVFSELFLNYKTDRRGEK